MSELVEVSGRLRESVVADVVFVHGIQGDPRKTWTNKDGGFWPSWLAEDQAELAVWSVGYEAAVSGWAGTAMPLFDRANNVLAELQASGLGDRPICWVTHSMGGLLVKQMLRNADSLAREFGPICDATCCIVFIATPHTGSDLASIGRYLGFVLNLNVNARELQALSASLRDLNIWYRNNHRRLGVTTQVFFENKKTKRVWVVDQGTADPGLEGVTPISLDADHSGICKPLGKDALIYKRTRNFILDAASAQSARTEHRGQAAGVVDDHFGSKARGVEFQDQAGEFFTGRTAALAALAGRLTGPDGRMVVVTGDPGSGKSALLGRLVSGKVPEVSGQPIPVYAAVYAAGLGGEEITSIIAKSAGVTTDDPAELFARLRGRSERLTVVLDGLDEAGTGAEEARRRTAGVIARKVLRPMAEIASVRLVVGTRPELAGKLGPDVFILNLDEDDYFALADVADYVEKILLAADEPERSTPYRGRKEMARTVADGVARRAGRCFLVARMVARTLAAAPAVVDVAVPGWWQRFPDEVGGAFEDYLSRFTPEREPMVRAVLTSLAWAGGQGLPRDRLWAPLAERVSGVRCTDTDVGWVLKYAGAYLAQSGQDGRPFYRLFHEALAQHLREEPRRAELQSRVMDALLSTVPQRDGHLDWESADPYLRSHLPAHAADAGRIDALLLDPGFLLVAVPRLLLRAAYAARSSDARAARAAYRMAADLFPEARRGERATALRLAAVVTSAAALAGRAAAMPSTAHWQARWAHWQLSGHRRLGGAAHATVSGVAALEIDGWPIAVAGGRRPAMAIFDLADGRPLFTLQTPFDDEDWVTCLAVGELGGAPVLVTGHHRNGLARWDLDDLIAAGEARADLGRRAAPSARLGTPAVRAVAVGFLDGAAVVAAAFEDCTCAVLGLRELDRKSGFATDGDPITALAWASLNGQPFLVTGSEDGRVTLRDAQGQERWPAAMQSCVVGVAAYQDGGPLHVVAAASFDGVQIWQADPARRSPQEQGTVVPELTLLEGNGSFTSLAAGGKPGHRLILTGITDRAVLFWEPSRDRWRRLTGHQKPVSSVTFGRIEGHDIAIAGGEDGSVRVWDLADDTGDDIDVGLQQPVHAAAWGRCGDLELIWSGCADGAVRAFKPDGGLFKSFPAHNLPVRDIATWRVDGGLLVATAGNDQAVMITEIRDDGQSANPAGWRQRRVSAIALGDARPGGIGENRIVLVVGDHRGQITVRDPSTREISAQYPVHEDTITAVRITRRAGQPVAVTSGIDGQIKVHQLDNLGRFENLAQHDAPIACLARGQWMDREALAFGTGRGNAQIIDLANGRLLQEHDVGSSLIHAVTLASIGGRPALIVGDDAGIIRIYREGAPRPEFLIPTGTAVRAVLAMDDGLIVIATLLGMLAITVR